jgi:hypothetical protein
MDPPCVVSGDIGDLTRILRETFEAIAVHRAGEQSGPRWVKEATLRARIT